MLGGGLLLAMAGAPVAVGVLTPHQGVAQIPNAVALYASGLSTLGMAGLIALPLAFVFALWLILGQQREVNLRILNQRARNRQNAINGLRTLSVILGAAGLIVGSLSAIYATLMAIQPELAAVPGPPLTFGLAIPCFVLGAGAYALGRLGR